MERLHEESFTLLQHNSYDGKGSSSLHDYDYYDGREGNRNGSFYDYGKGSAPYHGHQGKSSSADDYQGKSSPSSNGKNSPSYDHHDKSGATYDHHGESSSSRDHLQEAERQYKEEKKLYKRLFKELQQSKERVSIFFGLSVWNCRGCVVLICAEPG